jgi:hypothetical protein
MDQRIADDIFPIIHSYLANEGLLLLEKQLKDFPFYDSMRFLFDPPVILTKSETGGIKTYQIRRAAQLKHGYSIIYYQNRIFLNCARQSLITCLRDTDIIRTILFIGYRKQVLLLNSENIEMNGNKIVLSEFHFSCVWLNLATNGDWKFLRIMKSSDSIIPVSPRQRTSNIISVLTKVHLFSSFYSQLCKLKHSTKKAETALLEGTLSEKSLKKAFCTMPTTQWSRHY